MKVLNMSKVARSDSRFIMIDGVSHPVSMTVENFLETTRIAEELADEPSLRKQVLATIDMIARSAPGIPVAALEKMELEELQAIVAFIRGEDVQGVEVSKQVQGEAETAGEAKK